jgi:hypothetical protein
MHALSKENLSPNTNAVWARDALCFVLDDYTDKKLDARCRYGTYRNKIQHTFGNLRRRRRYGTYRNTLQRYKMIFGSVLLLGLLLVRALGCFLSRARHI